ncbi:hypothetical protein [Geobacillus jurassicus]|uniref:Uncharacterized protein n=1 Tax=Geobacillus jurassicus TaxID=235932 RepID=A0ABV6GTK1_9BACL|nr:hypothetical protein [Geobacillus jurassicus]
MLSCGGFCQSLLNKSLEQEALFELRFWMQILGDHCRFILEELDLLPLLMADHMEREECYCLQKLAETTGEVKPPACDPTKPRTE